MRGSLYKKREARAWEYFEEDERKGQEKAGMEKDSDEILSNLQIDSVDDSQKEN